MKSETGPCPQMAGRDGKKEAGPSRLAVAVITCEVCLGRHKMSKVSAPRPTRILKIYMEATYNIQLVSTPHCSLKNVFLKMVPTVGMVGRT